MKVDTKMSVEMIDSNSKLEITTVSHKEWVNG